MSVLEPGRKRAPWSLRFRDDVQLIDRQIVQDLHRSGRPTNGDATQALITQPEMQAPIVLTTESRSSVHHLALARVAELRRHLGADGAAIAPRSDELELDPVQARRNAEQSQRHRRRGRSEEHTSELQSRSDLVCRLLLEKK